MLMDNGKCMLDEENILKRVSEGDMSAFQDLYYEYYGKTKSFLTGFVRDPIVCEDLTQEIFVKVWTMRHILPEVRSLNSYLYRMSKNVASELSPFCGDGAPCRWQILKMTESWKKPSLLSRN
jgi:hypothetical protein